MDASILYRTARSLIRLALGFYFRRIERFHLERVPATGPVLFTSNHPNSLTDSFLIGASVPRRVNFVATVKLFRFKPAKWLLTRCGVIAINRVADDPKAMRSVVATFEACYRVLERGEAVGIFPEGITYEDSQLKEIKSGAARMALELENRHNGALGLQIVPVGLTFSAKEQYRSDALVHFGEPLLVATFLDGYSEHRKECITRLTSEIEHRIQSLILHLPHLEHERVIAAVKRLYLERLHDASAVPDNVAILVAPEGQHLDGLSGFVSDLVGMDGRSPSPAEELMLTQRIVRAVEQVYESEPHRAAAFTIKLDQYERQLNRLKLSDEQISLLDKRGVVLGRALSLAALIALGAPLAAYGWVHRLLPYTLVQWSITRFTEPGKLKAQTATAAIEAGIVAFGLFYGLCVFIVHRLFGWPWSLWYAMSLPPLSLLAHYYSREFRHLLQSVREAILLFRAPLLVRRLSRLRQELIQQIEKAHRDRKQEQKA